MRPLQYWMASMFVAALAAGCSHTVNSVERADSVGRPHAIADKRVITDHAVGEMASIIAVHEGVASGDLAKVEVDVYNTRSSQQHFNYKFEWYDNEGMIVDSPMSIWQAKIIDGNEQVALVGVAPNPRAKDFKLKLKESNSN